MGKGIPLTAAGLAAVGGALISDNAVRGLSICSSPRLSHYSTRTIATANNWDLYRIRLRNLLPEPVVGLVFAFSNHTVKGGGLYEGPNDNAIVVAGAVQTYGVNANDETTSRVPVTFSGQMTATVPPKGTVYSDIVPFFVAPGGDYWLRCGVSTPVTNGVYPTSGCVLGGTATFAVNNGEGSKLNQSTTNDLYYGGSTIGVGPQLLIYGAEAVYAVTASGKVYPSLQVVGDSITLGFADPGDNDGSFAAFNRGGWAQRALSAIGKPYTLGAISGESGFSTSTGYITGYGRYARDHLGRSASHVIAAYGRNDINVRYNGGSGDNAAQILAFLQAGVAEMVRQVCGRGKHLAITTVLPAPGSTTGHTTAAGAIPTSPARADEAARQAYNVWLRDTSASGCRAQMEAIIAGIGSRAKFRVIDICAPIETNQAGVLTPNGGCLLVPAVTTIYESGTASALGTTTTLTDSSKSWTPNAYRGRVVWIHAGTGQYANAVIQYNSATVLTMIAPFSGSATPDATSQYRIVDTPTADATHPAPWGNAVIAAGVQAEITAFLALK